MSLKIDGYVAPDKEIALETGRTFEYTLNFGKIVITSKMAGKANFAWRNAINNYQQWKERRDSLRNGGVDAEADDRFAKAVYDHLVISWSTTIKSDGRPIEPTRDNFVELMTSDACARVLTVYLQDANDETLFRAVTSSETEGNSGLSSDGASGGQTKKSGSAT